MADRPRTQRRRLGANLEWHNGSIRVVVAVPRKLQGKLGKTKLKQSLGTDSPALAERLKWRVIASLKAQLQAAEPERAVLLQEALEWRREIADDPAEQPVLMSPLYERVEEIEEREGEDLAVAFFKVATGEETPFDLQLETYLAEADMKARSKSEARLAARRLRDWLHGSSRPATVERLDRRVAGTFISEHLAPRYERATVNKYLSFLSGYWRWLVQRGYAKENPWLDQSFKRERKRALFGEEGRERPFSDEEARRLLYGPASPRLRSVMWIAALSGMRIDEVCRLRVGDCRDGWFAVNARRRFTGEGKTAAAHRRVPIHSELKALVETLCRGRSEDDYLIPDIPEPEGIRERSMPVSKEFTRYRRGVGVDERPGGKRRSNVNFHSWRRWFIKKARDAGTASPWTLADIVGHEASTLPLGLTMNQYPGPADDAKRIECIESVRPPLPITAADQRAA